MRLWSDSFAHGGPIPTRCAFGRPDPRDQVALSDNLNPHLAWSGLPAGTRSLVLLCRDPDVPSSGDKVNQEGMTVPASLPRVDFYHWVLVDLPADTGAIAEGEFARGVVPRGKEGPGAPRGARQGLNNYTQWFAGDAAMAGKYFGYDGPCPPWNDEIVHHYHFTLYALGVPRCPVEGVFDGPAVRAAIASHVLDETTITGIYAINPRAR